MDRNSTWYDDAFKAGGNNGMYHVPYKDSPYYKMWESTLKYLRGRERILELGCGVGQYAKMLKDREYNYIAGVDFSGEAISRAAHLNAKSGIMFLKRNVLTYDFNIFNYDVIVMLEILEHITDQDVVLKRIEKNRVVIMSLPNFQSESHVRFFNNVEEIRKVYDKYLRVFSVEEHVMSGGKKTFLVVGISHYRGD